jgi:hypothetical protein
MQQEVHSRLKSPRQLAHGAARSIPCGAGDPISHLMKKDVFGGQNMPKILTGGTSRARLQALA